MGPTLDVEGGVVPWCVNKRRRGTLGGVGGTLGGVGGTWAKHYFSSGPNISEYFRVKKNVCSSESVIKPLGGEGADKGYGGCRR